MIGREQTVDDFLVHLNFAFLSEGIAHTFFKKRIAGLTLLLFDLIANGDALAGEAGKIGRHSLDDLTHDLGTGGDPAGTDDETNGLAESIGKHASRAQAFDISGTIDRIGSLG